MNKGPTAVSDLWWFSLQFFNFMLMWKQYTFSGYHMNNDLHFTDEGFEAKRLMTCPNSSANNQLIDPVFKHQKASHWEILFLTTKLGCLSELRSLYTFATNVYQIYKHALATPLLTKFWYVPTDPGVHVLYISTLNSLYGTLCLCNSPHKNHKVYTDKNHGILLPVWFKHFFASVSNTLP